MLPASDHKFGTPRLEIAGPEPAVKQPASKSTLNLILAALLIIAVLLIVCGYYQGQADKYHKWYVTESYRSDSIAMVNQKLHYQLEQLNNQLITRKTSSRLTRTF